MRGDQSVFLESSQPMGREYTVAVVGATGLVGQTMCSILAERCFPVKELRLLASARSADSVVSWKGRQITVEETTEASFRGVDLVLIATGNDISKRFSPVAVEAGAIVVDNSSAFRLEDWVPLVVPEVNAADVDNHRGIIANPNCSTIQLVVALNPIHRVNPIKRIVVDTYQSVSGTGKEAVEELRQQVARYAAGDEGEISPRVYPYQIAFNLLPHIDVWLPDGSSREEYKMVAETRKIMHLSGVKIVATTVRVPVFYAHSEAIHVELTEPMSPEEARACLRQAPGVVVQDDLSKNDYPMPLPASGRDEVFVGRIRRNEVFDNGLSLWVVADNIRKGAALNAVQVAETLVARGKL